MHSEMRRSNALLVVIDDVQIDFSDFDANICSTLLSALSVSELVVFGFCCLAFATAKRESRYFLNRQEAGNMKYSIRSVMSW